MLMLIGTCAMGDSAKLRLGPEGDVLAWLVVGALPNPGESLESCKGFDEDYLTAAGGEAQAHPVEGSSLEAAGMKLKWRLALASEREGLDFCAIFATREPRVAYAYTVIESPSDREARLLLGSDDGVKVWVNGDLVHTSHATRGVNRDEDKVDIKLQSGKNRILFKVDQHFGGWGMMARIVNPDGSAAKDLVENLQIQPAPLEKEPAAMKICRLAAGKAGSMDVSGAMVYIDQRTRAKLWMERFSNDPADQARFNHVLESAVAKITSAASSNADAVSTAINASNNEIKADWDYIRGKLVREMQDPPPLVKTDVSREDYVSVMPGGRYFMHADGTPFTPIGYNHNPDWTTLERSNPESRNYDPKVTDEFFAHLHKCGVNLVRLMIETPGSGLIEDPLGTFRPEHVRWIDHIVNAARKNNIKLMITPWDTFWMVRRWEISPYSSANGGPVVQRIDFITNREAVEAQKKRLKFLIDRWGNSGSVFAWELLNEGELYWKETPEQLSAWETEMTRFVREYEKKKWGRNHLLASSIAHPMPEGALGDVAYRQPGLDFATTHLYIGASRGPKEPIEPALNIRQGVEFALRAIKDNRPYIDGEDGPIDKWIEDGNLDNAVFHNMIWAHLASGGAGSGLRWPYRNPHQISGGMIDALGRMRKFADEAPWAKLSGAVSDKLDVQAPDGWIYCRTGTSRAAIVWVRAKNWVKPVDVAVRVVWPDGPALVKYRTYDTLSGTWLASGEAGRSGDAFEIELPSAPGSVAIMMQDDGK